MQESYDEELAIHIGPDPYADDGDDWIDWVRKPISEKEQKRLQRSILRGAPFGGDEWVRTTAEELGLKSTLRPRGRPKKQSANSNGGSCGE